VLQRRDFERVEALLEESLETYRELGNEQSVALSLIVWGVLSRNRGDPEQARAYYEEALMLCRTLGDRSHIALLLNNLARLDRDRQDWQRATARCAESLALYRELGDMHGLATVLSNLAVIAERRGAWEQAARLHGAIEAIVETVGSAGLSLSPIERAACDASVAAARAELGDRAFAAAVAEGRAAPPEQVAEAVLAAGAVEPAARAEGAPPKPSPPAPGRNASPLTRREREVAALVARGWTDRQVAEALVVTEGTVGVHLTNIFSKLDLHSRAQLAVWAAEHGLLSARPD
jgi:DNA-binding NarL/FixJ family response regulator